MGREAPVLHRRAGIRFWTVPAFARLGCRTAFFLRSGGVSRGDFRGLNLGLRTADRPEAVLRNRARALRAAGFLDLRPVVARQEHGTRLRLIRRADAGRGWQAADNGPAATDGLLTSVPGLPLAVTVADCLPVLLAAEKSSAVGAVHAGWRGIAREILPQAVRRFRREWGIAPGRLWAAIGPGIGPEAFIIRGEALRQLGRMFPEAVRPRLDGAAAFDLRRAAGLQLRRAGIPAEHIIVIRDSTAASPRRYFSHRRAGGQTGRMLGMIQKEIKYPALKG